MTRDTLLRRSSSDWTLEQAAALLCDVYEVAVGVVDITNPDRERDRKRLSLLLDRIGTEVPRDMWRAHFEQRLERR